MVTASSFAAFTAKVAEAHAQGLEVEILYQETGSYGFRTRPKETTE